MEEKYIKLLPALCFMRPKRNVRVCLDTRGKNSLLAWTNVSNPLRTVLNFCFVYIARFVPSVRMKNIIYRALGAKVGKDSAFGLGAMIDVFHPELIEIGDNSIIGYNTLILTHEFLVGQYRKGIVKIGDSVMVGANCTILPGVTIGDGAIVSAMSLVNRDVPAGAFAQGVPIKVSRRRTGRRR
jgi:acetyltransferase-like isoleucine patch superfamily enzyme